MASARRLLETSPAVGSLVPVVALLAAMIAADAAAQDTSLDALGMLAATPFYVAFVSLPSALPLVVARSVRLRVAVLCIMTATAAVAGTVVVTSDDAQAGLAVLLVTYVALPLAAVLWVAQVVATQWRSR